MIMNSFVKTQYKQIELTLRNRISHQQNNIPQTSFFSSVTLNKKIPKSPTPTPTNVILSVQHKIIRIYYIVNKMPHAHFTIKYIQNAYQNIFTPNKFR